MSLAGVFELSTIFGWRAFKATEMIHLSQNTEMIENLRVSKTNPKGTPNAEIWEEEELTGLAT